jgi:outer membrane assembly lipoprotein YfiO/YbgC/YbaW family acyl-CoA thioester hydrolase
MGVAHHSHFFVWFELGRTELMREAGCAYGALEDNDGVFFPVIEAGAVFREPARYDEVLEIETKLTSTSGVRVRFDYVLRRPEDSRILATGFTVHASCGRDGKPSRLPESLRSRLIAGVLCLALAAASSGCAASKKKAAQTAEVLTAEQTMVRVEAMMGHHQLRKAKNLLQKVQFTQAERPKYEPLVRLALADCTYYMGDDLSLIEARSKYLDFVTLYADHPLAPYAQFQAGMCSVKQIYSASRDQAQTQVAIDDFREIDKRWPASPWARAARQFIGKGQDGLAEHEFLIGTFYWKKRAYRAATDRFNKLLEAYPTYRQKDKVYYWLGRTLMDAEKPDEGRVWLDQVLNDFPRSKYVKPAKELLAKSAKKDAADAAKREAAKPSS